MFCLMIQSWFSCKRQTVSYWMESFCSTLFPSIIMEKFLNRATWSIMSKALDKSIKFRSMFCFDVFNKFMLYVTLNFMVLITDMYFTAPAMYYFVGYHSVYFNHEIVFSLKNVRLVSSKVYLGKTMYD